MQSTKTKNNVWELIPGVDKEFKFTSRKGQHHGPAW